MAVPTIYLDEAIANYGVNAAYQPRIQFTPPDPIANAVTIRDPGANDDSSKGYAVDDRWYNPVTNKLFKSTAVGVGAAAWLDITPANLPWDAAIAAGATGQAVFGMRKMHAAYAGPCIRIRRDDDKAELDIGFDSNGALDMVALAAFIGTPLIPFISGTKGSVVKWYDQSGNGFDAVAPTETATAQLPRIHLQQTTNGVADILFTNFPLLQDRANSYLILPAGITGTTTAATILLGARGSSSARTNAFAQIGTTGGSTSPGLTTVSASGGKVTAPGSGTLQSTRPAMVNPAPMGAVYGSGSGNSRLFYNEERITGTQTGTTAQTGGSIGATGASYAARGASEVFYAGFANTAWTDAQYAAFTDAAIFAYKLTPQIRDVLVLDGDSFIDGQQSTFLRTPPRRLEAGLLARPYRVYNVAVSGDRVYNPTAGSGRIGKYPTYVPLCFNSASGVKNVFVAQAATNDIAWVIPWTPGINASINNYYYNPFNEKYYLCKTGGVCAFDTGPLGTGAGITSGAAVFDYTTLNMADDIYNKITTLMNLAKATGFQKVFQITPLSSKEHDFLVVIRDDLVTRLRNNAANLSAIIDAVGDVALQDYRRSDMFYNDQHMRDGGMDRYSRIIAYQLNTVGEAA